LPYKTYKLTENKTLERSNLDAYISNFFTGDIYKDTKRYLRFNHLRNGLVVNDINAIATGHSVEETDESCKKLKGVFEQVIPDSGLVSAAEKVQEQTYLSYNANTQIGYQDKLYHFKDTYGDLVYSVAHDSDDSFTFTTLRKEVVSKLIALDNDWEHPVLTLDDNGGVRGDLLNNMNEIHGEKPIYTFTEETHVTFRWLDLDYIEKKMGEVVYPELVCLSTKKDVGGLMVAEHNCNQEKDIGKEYLDKIIVLLNCLKGVETIAGLTNYITENCTAVKDYGISLKDQLEEKREAGEFSLYFKKAESAGFILKEEAAKLKKDEFIEFKFMRNNEDVVLPQFFLKDETPRENHLRMDGERKLQMVFQHTIKRETHFQIDDRFNAANYGFGFKKDGEQSYGLELVASNPHYSDTAHIASRIDLICKASEERSKKKPLPAGDSDDQIKQQIEELLEYKIEPLMAKPEFNQDVAAINALSGSLTKVSSALSRGTNLELKAKVEEKKQLLQVYLNESVLAKEDEPADDMRLIGKSFLHDADCKPKPYTDADHIKKIISEIIRKLNVDVMLKTQEEQLNERKDLDYDAMIKEKENQLKTRKDNGCDPDAQKNQIEMLLEHRIKPLMAKDEFKKDMDAIDTLYESLNTLLNPPVARIGQALETKVDKIRGSLDTLYKQNEIKSNYEGEIEWYKGKTRLNLSGFIVFAAVAIVVPLFVVFPPAIPVLAIIVPVVFGVLSLAALGRGLYCNKSVKKQEQYLERYKRDIDPVKSTEFSSNIPKILLEYMGEVRKARVDNRTSHVVKENQILIP
jgi:hypothetical protein